MKQALILIDYQNDYFKGGKCELVNPDKALRNAIKLEKKFLNSGDPIFYIQHISNGDVNFFIKNTHGAKLHSSLNIQDKSNIIIKHEPDSFFETSLYNRLQKLNIKNLVVAGMMSHMCVDTSVRRAFSLGYKCTLIDDACATKDLAFDNKTIPASNVQTAFMASISGKFATVIHTKDYINKQ